jgi:hypothetical protein
MGSLKSRVDSEIKLVASRLQGANHIFAIASAGVVYVTLARRISYGPCEYILL